MNMSPATARLKTKDSETRGYARLANSPSATVSAKTPNPSFEARPNIKMPGPQSGLAHFPLSGPGISLPVPP